MTQNINQRLDWASNEALRDLPTVSADDHRSGMRHLASGVSIITSRDGETVVGLTATAVFLLYTYGPHGNGQPRYSWFSWAGAGVLYAAVRGIVRIISRSRGC